MTDRSPIDPAQGTALLNQLEDWRQQGLLEAAIDHWKDAAAATPTDDRLKNHLSTIATLLIRRGIEIFHSGEIEKALAYFNVALRTKPDSVPALNNTANCLRDLGRLDDSTACYQQALNLQPTFAEAHSGLLMNMHYTSGVTMAALKAAHQDWAHRHAQFSQLISVPKPTDPEKILRVGFVSSDFGQHPVGYFLVRYLENIDHAKFSLSAYADGRRDGYLADRLRASVAHYHNTPGLGDEEMAKQIQADGIDILIDLSGHTAGHRLGVFARKPAPVQIGWLGYPWENGLATMDYFIGDPRILPLDLQPFLQSKILQLPDSFVCFDPSPEAPPVGPLPALSGTPFTFGYIGNPAKCGGDVLNLWAEILKRVPQSRLLLKYQGFGEVECRKGFEEKFAARDVAPEQLIFQTSSKLPELFAIMQTIDLALDPFPFSGGLMTAMTLWMGVPVVTLPGETFSSRQGLSFLTSIGITDTVATNAEDYIQKAVALANDLPRLSDLRQKLRPAMAMSPFCDGRRGGKNLEALLGQAWCDAAAANPS